MEGSHVDGFDNFGEYSSCDEFGKISLNRQTDKT